ncbi:MAG: excisionase [Lachnospiraceae bacterium]|nr:excisionase [Lachnospiraceae bacterium]
MANNIKKYTLMHKNIPVADLELDEASCAISAVGPVYEKLHLPTGIPIKKGDIDRGALNEWWRGRAIPASRSGIRNALVELNLSTTQKLLEKCLGLSLSDQYWICPADTPIAWSQVNFFDHSFSDDVGNILFGQGSSGASISLMSPDNTSDGWLKKKWKIIDGKRCLIKGGSGATWQEPYNEVIASRLMDRLNIPHVNYSLILEDGYPYSVCEDFITPWTDLVSAWYVMQTKRKPNHVSIYQHYLNCTDSLKVPGIREALDRMMVLDYLIVNEDRHQNNFGVIRNAETLIYTSAAPLFDNGTSLWFDKPTAMINADTKINCKPFKNSHEEQIKLVSSFDWLDRNALHGIEEELRELLRDSIFIDRARCDALCLALKNRVAMLNKVIDSGHTLYEKDNCRSDVKENVAYSGRQDKKLR